MTYVTTLLLSLAQDNTLEAAKVDKAPAVDGDASDEAWGKAKPLAVTIKKADAPDQGGAKVLVKAVVSGDMFYLLMQWDDSTKDVEHRLWVWNAAEKEYEVGDMSEDCCSVAFQLQGDFNFNMLTRHNAKWDLWQWKASRTNPVGYAMDKTHVYSTDAFPGGKSHTGPKGKVFMARLEDAGTSVTKRVKAPEAKGADKIPQFIPQEPSGSAADVKAKGVWKDNKWTVEFSRKLKTGNADDREFAAGEKIPFAVAVFDHVEDEDHSVSENLTLVLPK